MPTVQERIHALWSPRSEEPIEYVAPSYTFSTSSNTRRTILKLMVVAICITAILFWLNRPGAEISPQVIASGTPFALSSVAPAVSEIVVDVEGKVRHPGLRTLASGARVADAIAAAGGVLPGVPKGSMNLAARVSDGQLIIVGQISGASASGGGTADSNSSAGRISLNSASESDFETLPGVGPVLAKRIIDWRTEHGTFGSLEDLQNVPGIGPKVFSNLSSYLTL